MNFATTTTTTTTTRHERSPLFFLWDMRRTVSARRAETQTSTFCLVLDTLSLPTRDAADSCRIAHQSPEWRYSTAILGMKSIHNIYFILLILKEQDLTFHILKFKKLFIFAGSPLNTIQIVSRKIVSRIWF